MRAVVVYESMFGNTEEVARAVAKGLGSDTPVLDVAAEPPATLFGFDLLVVGGPTHAFSMSRARTREEAVAHGARPDHAWRGVREWLAGLPDDAHLRIATFDTRVTTVRRLPGSAAHRAAKEIRRHRLGQLVAEQSFYVEDTSGPLAEGELERAARWGALLADQLSAVP